MATEHFHFTAETGIIGNIPPGNQFEHWASFSTPLVTLSTAQAQKGSWSVRHEMSPSNTQTGKVIKNFNFTPGGHPDYTASGHGLTQAYYSSWYRILAGLDDDFSKNNMQWKTRNKSPTTVSGGVVSIIGFEVKAGVRQIVFKSGGSGSPAGLFPQWEFDTDSQGGSKWRVLTNPSALPNDQWFHMEVFYKATETNGQCTIWLDGVEQMDIFHADLNLLTRFNKTAGAQSNNEAVYFGIGAYGSGNSGASTQIMHTDEAIVADARVGATPQPSGGAAIPSRSLSIAGGALLIG